MLTKVIVVMMMSITLRITRHVTFFENVSYYATESNSELSSLRASSSTSSYTPLPTLTYTLLLFPLRRLYLSIPSQSPHIFNIHSFLFYGCYDWCSLYGCFVFSGRSSFPSCNSLRDRQPLAMYRSEIATSFSLEFATFLAAIHYLQEPKLYAEAIPNGNK